MAPLDLGRLLILVTPRRMTDRVRDAKTLYLGRGGASAPQPAPAAEP